MMNEMYVGQSPLERGHDEPQEDPLVTENNRLTNRIAELTDEVAHYRDVVVFVLGICDDNRFEDDEVRHNARNAARNALKDGV